jgi:hypothetical protein
MTPPFPTVPGPRPADLDSWSPGNRQDYIEHERRGFRDVPCPDCKLRGKRLYRCNRHRTWGR